MKKPLFLLAVLFIGHQTTFSQVVRIHFMGGLANYTGDLQPRNFTLNQAKGAIAAGATFELSPHFALRSEYSFGKVGATDSLTNNERVRTRNLNFTSIIKEFNLLGEYTFFDLEERRLSPYVFAGIAAYYSAPYTYTSAGTKVYLAPLNTEGQGLAQYPGRTPYKKIKVALPFGGGIKYALSDDVHVGFELGWRKLFTDYLDDVSTNYADEATLLQERGPLAVELAYRGDELKTNPVIYPAEGSQRGGPKKDYYYFGQFRIAFRMPWFDDRGGSRSRVGCPTRVL